MIIEAPADTTVKVSANVVFPCNAVTDPQEKDNLDVFWEKNGERIVSQEDSVSFVANISSI